MNSESTYEGICKQECEGCAKGIPLWGTRQHAWPAPVGPKACTSTLADSVARGREITTTIQRLGSNVERLTNDLLTTRSEKRQVEEERNRLRQGIEDAPHDPYCAVIQRPPGGCDCNCQKFRALASTHTPAEPAATLQHKVVGDRIEADTTDLIYGEKPAAPVKCATKLEREAASDMRADMYGENGNG